MSWHLVAPARIHINSIDLSGSFGIYGIGIGFAVGLPCIEMTFTRENGISVTGDDCARALEFLHAIAKVLPGEKGISLHIKQQIPCHMGLGSGTQLALACGLAWSICNDMNIPVAHLAKITQRGYFSGVGLATFNRGGLVIDQGYVRKNLIDKEPIPCMLRYLMPVEHKVVLALPVTSIEPLSHVKEIDDSETSALIDEAKECAYHVLVQLLPALARNDSAAFYQAISAISTLGYKKLETNQYGLLVNDLVKIMVSAGAECAGMSSGGPVVYAIATDETKARSVQAAAVSYLSRFDGGEAFITTFDNVGVRWSQQS